MAKAQLMILIPAYNEQTMIGSVLRSLPKKMKGIKKITKVVVDDGSIDKTALVAIRHKATVLQHIINRGLGGALGTGFQFAREIKADIIVTIDADGQHKGSDIVRLVQPILQKKADVVIGSRLISKSSMPFIRKTVNRISNVITWFFFGVRTSDSQSGFRAFSKKALQHIDIRTQRMEVSSELFREIQRLNLRKYEVPIEAVYTSYSLGKGQPLTNASNILTKLIIRLVR